jgi:predicted DCC family thiol-disulfide oxidoreductase YuxK
MARRTRPLLLFDGSCGFCSECARVVERIGPNAEVVAWQLTDLAELGITAEQATEAVQWLEVDGTTRSGHEAIAAMLIAAGSFWKVIGRLILLPGISSLAARVYGSIAAHRHRLPGGTPACALDDDRGGE